MSKKDKQLLVFSAEDHVLVKRRKADTFIPLTEYLNASSFTENWTDTIFMHVVCSIFTACNMQYFRQYQHFNTCMSLFIGTSSFVSTRRQKVFHWTTETIRKTLSGKYVPTHGLSGIFDCENFLEFMISFFFQQGRNQHCIDSITNKHRIITWDVVFKAVSYETLPDDIRAAFCNLMISMLALDLDIPFI